MNVSNNFHWFVVMINSLTSFFFSFYLLQMFKSINNFIHSGTEVITVIKSAFDCFFNFSHRRQQTTNKKTNYFYLTKVSFVIFISFVQLFDDAIWCWLSHTMELINFSLESNKLTKKKKRQQKIYNRFDFWLTEKSWN